MGKIENFLIDQIKKENFIITIHARERMNERFVTVDDIVSAANTASEVIFQSEKETYLLKGNSCWGEELSIVAAIENEIVIVTVFYEEFDL